MKVKLVDFLMQRSTWMAFGTAALAVLSYVKPEWVTVAAGVLSAFGLGIRDRQR